MRNNKGSAYMLVLVMLLLLFMMVTVALTVTARSREVSTRHPYYANLYDIAVAGNERTLFLLRAALDEHRAALDTRLRGEILSGDVEAHVLYRDGQFHLTAPEDGYYAALFRTYAHELFEDFFTENFRYALGKWTLEYNLTANYTEELTDIFHTKTTLTPQSNGFLIQSATDKTFGAQTSYPVTVEAEIVWPVIPHEELFLPAYKWRDMPEYFRVCLYAGGEIINYETGARVVPEEEPLLSAVTNAPPPSSFVNASLLSMLSAYHEQALVITGDASFDIAALYDGSSGMSPVFMLSTAGSPLRLHTSEPAADSFNGVILCAGDLVLDGVSVTGTVMAEGDIYLTTEAVFTYDGSMLFKLPLPQAAQHDLFDYLRLTRFTETAGGPSGDIAYILNRLAFDLTGENGRPCAVAINNFDGAAPAMVKSKKIAN